MHRNDELVIMGKQDNIIKVHSRLTDARHPLHTPV